METTQRHIYSVSELNHDVSTLLGKAFPLLWIQGEISNFACPSSGHWYFTLKDNKAQVKSAMFKMRNRSVGFTPQNGMEVLVRAKVALYEPRGDYQLIVEQMEEAGIGALQRAFEELKNKLNTQGLFAAEHKKTLPVLPRQIGVITSPTGAAIRDVLHVLKRRFPAIPVIIYPVPVQGADAGKEIARMIAKADQRQECDVLILTRGGGSLEDLWSFNEEIVAKAVYDCETPIVCGVGHEIDFTIADFVADIRAPTPSAAAELVVPDSREWLAQFQRLERRLGSVFSLELRRLGERVGHLGKRLVHPAKRLQDHAQRLDELELRLKRTIANLHQREHHRLATLSARIQRHTPAHQLEKLQARHQVARTQILKAMKRFLHDKQEALKKLSHGLDTVSPLATLERGYAIVTNEKHEVVRDSRATRPGERLQARLAKGRLNCVIEDVLGD